MTTECSTATASLATVGFARYASDVICPGLSSAGTWSLLEPLSRYFADLPLDEHDPAAGRYRRYAAAVLLPWARTVSWIPGVPDPTYGMVSHFSQGDHNPEYPGTVRRFPYFDAAISDDPLLLRLVLFDFDQIPWRARFDRSPLHVGVHFVKLSVTHPDIPAVSSPDCLHQDGGTFATYFVHLLARENAIGGANTIAAPQCAGRRPDEVPGDLIRARFTLERPLDSYAVEDSLVSHYVGPIRRGPEPRPGVRSTVLIGITPFVQQA